MSSRSRGTARRKTAAISLVAFLIVGIVTAVPSIAAPEKIFSLRAPATLSAGTQTIQLTIKNETPSGNSSINSLEIRANGPVTINSATAPSGTVTVTSSSIKISNISPIKNRQTYVVSANVTVGTSNGCAGSITWDATTWTGSSFSGDNFRLLRTETNASGVPYSNLTTTTSSGCTLAFDPAPVSSAVNTNITVGVNVLDASSTPVAYTGSVTLTVTGATVNGTADSGTDTSSPFIFTVTGSTPGNYTATASSTGLTSISSNFTLFSTNSSISGQKWRDHNNDGTRDDDEQGIEGWTISAFDANGDLAGTATTNGAGNYTINNLAAGQTYTVCEFAPAEDAGFEYRGWFQSVPAGAASADLCAEVEGAEPNGYSVTIAGPSGEDVIGKDFFNVRTITIPEGTTEINCGTLPPGGVFTVGDGVTEPVGTITVDPATCKPGEYVFETWFDAGTGEQNVAFYPVAPTSSETMPVTEFYEWLIDDDRTQHTLVYDDFAPFDEFRPMLFCDFAGGDIVMPVDPDDPEEHTSCLLETHETATANGVNRTDLIYSFVDGQRKI